ncbi:MAG: metal-binding protein [Lachnospiraceae bacterium]|nr:metal-binding protein [Lachnospiraceae bacterium]
MENNSRYFKNTACEYYPCHKGVEDFNCLFCFCPMYRLKACPGKPEYIEHDGKRIKSCGDCTFPHRPENYDKIMKVLAANKYMD